MAIEFKKYAGPSIQKILDYIAANGWPQPSNPLLSIGFGVEHNSEIKAMSLIQSVPMIEPFHAEPGYGEHLGKLFEMTQEFIIGSQARRVLMHTSHPAMKRMLTSDKVRAERMTDEFYQWFRE